MSEPDLHFLGVAVRQLLSDARVARENERYIKARLDAIYMAMATSPEIKRLRDDVTKSLNHEDDLDIRVTTIESHLGLKNPLME
jgi:hypothetical protein